MPDWNTSLDGLPRDGSRILVFRRYRDHHRAPKHSRKIWLARWDTRYQGCWVTSTAGLYFQDEDIGGWLPVPPLPEERL